MYVLCRWEVSLLFSVTSLLSSQSTCILKDNQCNGFIMMVKPLLLFGAHHRENHVAPNNLIGTIVLPGAGRTEVPCGHKVGNVHLTLVKLQINNHNELLILLAW